MADHTCDEVLSLRRMIAIIQSDRRDEPHCDAEGNIKKKKRKEDAKATILLEGRRLQEIISKAGQTPFSRPLVRPISHQLDSSWRFNHTFVQRKAMPLSYSSTAVGVLPEQWKIQASEISFGPWLLKLQKPSSKDRPLLGKGRPSSPPTER